MPTVIEELRANPARTNSAIAALCGVTRDTVRLTRQRHGVDPLPRGKPRQPARVAVRLTRAEWGDVLEGLAEASGGLTNAAPMMGLSKEKSYIAEARLYEALAARIEAQLPASGERA